MTPQERRTQHDFIAEIFELECKVKPDFAFHIVRDAYGVIEISFFKKENGLDARYHRHWGRDLTEIKTHEARLAVISHIWECIPAECKKDPLKNRKS